MYHFIGTIIIIIIIIVIIIIIIITSHSRFCAGFPNKTPVGRKKR